MRQLCQDRSTISRPDGCKSTRAPWPLRTGPDAAETAGRIQGTRPSAPCLQRSWTSLTGPVRGEITGQLPSITELTAQTGLAVGTVRRGIDLLVKEGLVQTVPGRGTFVKR